MANELVVSSTDEGLRIAILENRKLVELHHEKRNNLFQVGDIFTGRVTRILPSLNAAFVDVGYSRDAFLHYLDLGPQIKTQTKYLNAVQNSGKHLQLGEVQPQPDIDKHGKMANVLKSGQTVLVQIMKEAISTKGPRLSSQLSIPGQYLILMPFSADVAVSRKFKSSEEKRRVKKYLEAAKPNNVGVIVRTAAEGVELEKLKQELHFLLDRWDELIAQTKGGKPPRKVLSEMDRTSSILRDMLSIGFDTITTDDKAIHHDLQEFLEEHQPENKKSLQLKRGRTDIFEAFGIERQIKAAFGKNVNMSNGSYLVIEHTEALHVIDVNSGSQRGAGDPEENALRINLEAASELARQLRLRDMGGIIVVDFIDQRRMENRKKVFQRLKDEMKKDRARHTILPMSRFGLIQITRQRVRPEVNISTDETCPCCGGTGKIGPSVLMSDKVLRDVDYLIRKSKIKKLRILCNPFLHAYLTKGMRSIRSRWFFKYGRWIRIEPSSSLPFTTVKYIDGNEEEIKLD